MRFTLEVTLTEEVDGDDAEALLVLADAILDILCESDAPAGVQSYDGLDPDPDE